MLTLRTPHRVSVRAGGGEDRRLGTMRSASGRDQRSNTSPHARGPVRRLSITPSPTKTHLSLYPPALPTRTVSAVPPWPSRYAAKRNIPGSNPTPTLGSFYRPFHSPSSFHPTLPCRHRLHIFTHLTNQHRTLRRSSPSPPHLGRG